LNPRTPNLEREEGVKRVPCFPGSVLTEVLCDFSDPNPITAFPGLLKEKNG